ncbi:Rubredoxin-like zinc ribbon domain protein [Marine Group I thaumarchaeote SCGC AAA799-P11]|uniref:Rubredoxin-like zinc ribbon domain protein n=1 Tax=Marine Group I thaumarchaeote SCGC AAA799-P11 TaxID=1502295 RepID=A0A087S2Q0_9ARCH|nr:Rubredoxin-like zinc ribbon domain protein [Marine Group I thaumarchaeote SCGC AAA799-P11]
MSFESELSKGNFLIPKCTECKKIVWPPMEFCDHCMGKTSLKGGDFEGKIMEFSRQNDNYFCIVEIEDSFRIMAKMIQKPHIEQVVTVSKCGISKGNYFFEVI